MEDKNDGHTYNQRLWNYVDRSSQIPSEESQQTTWKKKDHTALSTIRLWVANQMLVYVASTSTSKEVFISGNARGTRYCAGTPEIVLGTMQGRHLH